MSIDLDLQLAVDGEGLPCLEDFERWVQAALSGHGEAELTIRVVGSEESRELNNTYRGKDYPTNVLSFPAELPENVGLPLLGDIVICAPLVAGEAQAQAKTAVDHWAHLTIHGVLHLLGYDHIEDEEAERMEALEVSILESLGIANPY